MPESGPTQRQPWTKTAFYNLAEGFWATRVANGLTTPEEAEQRVEQQQHMIDGWCPEEPTHG